MRVYFDIDSNTLVNDPTYRSPTPSLAFKRGDYAEIQLTFVSNSTALSAVSGMDVRFGVKAEGNYEGTFVTSASATSFTGNTYILKPNFNTVPLNTLLLNDGVSGNDIPSVNLMGEFTYSSDGSTWQSSNTFGVVVYNDVIKLDEGTPLEYANASINPITVVTADSVQTITNALKITIDGVAFWIPLLTTVTESES